MPSLEILSGKHSGKTFKFEGKAKIGKDESCQVRLPDAGVSRFHAEIEAGGGGAQLSDLGSSNGTYVNFKKRGKGESTPLKDKDIVFFGRTVTKFWAGAAPARGGVPAELLRSTVPFKGLRCPQCGYDLERELSDRAREAEQVELIRRLRLHELDDAALERLLAQAR